EVAADDERAAHHRNRHYAPGGGARRYRTGGKLRTVHGAGPEVAAIDRRAERKVTSGDGDGSRRAERMGAPMQGGKVGRDEDRRHDGDEDRAEPQEHGAR